MTENNFNDLQRHSAIQDARISNLETKFEMFMQSIKENNDKRAAEMKDFKDEMRDRDNQRHAEIQAIDAKIAASTAATDAKIDSIGKHVRNISIAAFVGIGAMVITSVVGIAAMIWTVINK